MKVSDIMINKVVTIRSDATLDEAVRLMLKNRISGLPVVNEEGAVVGLITEGDLLRRTELGTAASSGWLTTLLSAGRVAQDYVQSHARRVGELIRGEVVSVSPDASLPQVVALMQSRGVKRLPVIDNGQLVGIVARSDLVGALLQLSGDGAHPPALEDARIRSAFLKEVDRQPWTPRGAIDCRVSDGVLELRGVITDERMREGLCVIAENTPGARRVRDHLVCIEPISGALISQGSDIERPAGSRP